LDFAPMMALPRYVHHAREELAHTMRHPDRSVLDTAVAARRRRNVRRAA